MHSTVRRFKTQQQAPLEVIFGSFQNRIADWDANILPHQFGDQFQRPLRLSGLSTGINSKQSGIGIGFDKGEYGIRKSIFLPDLLKKDRAHPATEDSVQYQQRVFIGMIERQ